MIYIINTGTSSNQGDGDTLRSAFNKINQNFQYLSTASVFDASNISTDVVPVTSDALTLGTATSVWKTVYLGSDGLQIGGNVLTVSQGDLTLNGLPISSSGYTLPTASDTVLGGVKIGSGISIDGNGTISATTATQYVLPVASETILGGVKIGAGITVDGDGVISASGGANTADFIFTGTEMLVANLNSLSIHSNSSINIGSSSTQFSFNGSSKLLQIPNGGGIVTPSSGDTFFIRNVAQIQFADNTILSTAGAGGTGSVSSLTNSGNVVSLSSTGTTTFPGPVVLSGASYSAFTQFVSSSTVTISAGFGATPQAGWKYNGVTIQSVDILSGAFRLYLQFPVFLNAGYYPLTPVPGIGGTVIFSDGTEQSTAWTGSFTPTNELNWASPAPTTIAEAINRLAAVVKVLNNNVGA